MKYLLHHLIYFEIYLIVTLSLNLVVGYCGLLTLAHAGYFAIGGYAYAVLTIAAGWGFIPAALAGVAIGATLSLAVSLPSWRLRDDFYLLVSLAVQAIIFTLIYNWYSSDGRLGSWTNLTNGPSGITGIPRPSLFGWTFSSQESFALLTSCVAISSGFILWILMRSPWGRVLKCMRDDEVATRAIGKNTRLAKIQACAIACAFASLAGSLYAAYVQFIDPSSGSLNEGISMLTMVIVGGLGNFRGSVVGAMVVVLLPELIRLIPGIPDGVAANLRLLIYGALLVAMMHWRPQGLAGTYRLH
jgi:branched-chain amino acid transport system permease protein